MATKWDVRKADGTRVELQVGMWYVGMNYEGRTTFAENPDGSLRLLSTANYDSNNGAGAIAQYVGDDEFYDDGDDEPVRMQDYEYILESHMGRVPA